jgi:hypothetical protein
MDTNGAVRWQTNTKKVGTEAVFLRVYGFASIGVNQAKKGSRSSTDLLWDANIPNQPFDQQRMYSLTM